jgi:hypothetical protein
MSIRIVRLSDVTIADVVNVDDLARWIPTAELAQLERDTLILAG